VAVSRSCFGVQEPMSLKNETRVLGYSRRPAECRGSLRTSGAAWLSPGPASPRWCLFSARGEREGRERGEKERGETEETKRGGRERDKVTSPSTSTLRPTGLRHTEREIVTPLCSPKPRVPGYSRRPAEWRGSLRMSGGAFFSSSSSLLLSSLEVSDTKVYAP